MDQKSTKRFETYSNIFESIKREINDINDNISFLSNSSSKKKPKSSSKSNNKKIKILKSSTSLPKKLFDKKKKKLQIIVDDIEEKDEEYIISPNKSIHKRGNSEVIDFQITNFIKDVNSINNNSNNKNKINNENKLNLKNTTNNNNNNNLNNKNTKNNLNNLNNNMSIDFNEINEGKNKIILTSSSKKESLSDVKDKIRKNLTLIEEKRKLFYKKNNVINKKHQFIAENVEMNEPCCHCQFQ